MSKRKHKNKFRFHPHPAMQADVAPSDQQALLPLAEITMVTRADLPCEARSGVSEVAAPEPAVLVAAEPAASLEPDKAPAGIAPDATLGQRLRAAREARGLSREEAAHALKLPVTVLKALEAEQFERIGHGVYLRGYLSKYLQLLDLPQILAERVVQDHAQPPPLTTNGTVSRPRYLFERYSGSALYLILTGVIIVPAVLVALRVGFDQDLARITPLDAPPSVIAAPLAHHPASAPAAESSAAAGTAVIASAKAEEAPLAASMTPFPPTAETRPNAAPTPASASATTALPANRLHLSLTQPSWVEIVDADGKKLEYGLLAAGSERDYASELALDVRIGNADGASLQIDGKAQDLAAFRHANVAHIRVADGVASMGHSGG